MLKNQCLTYTEKYEGHYENLQPYFRLGLKLKTIYHVLEFNQSQWLKPFTEFNTQSRTYGEQNNDKNEKALYKLTTNVEQCCIGKKKRKLTLKFKKPTYIQMCILKLSKVLTYEFH